MLERLKDIASLVRDIGVIVGVPTVVAVGVNLYGIQKDSLEHQVRANESQIKLLEAQSAFLKETQFDRAAALIKGQKQIYEIERQNMEKDRDEFKRLSEKKIFELESETRGRLDNLFKNMAETSRTMQGIRDELAAIDTKVLTTFNRDVNAKDILELQRDTFKKVLDSLSDVLRRETAVVPITK